MPAIEFAEVTAPAPDLDALAARVDELLAGLENASDTAAATALVHDWDELRRTFDTWSALVDLRFNQDTANPDYKAELEKRDELSPRWTELEVSIKRALLSHPLRAELEKALGAQAFALWEVDVLSFDPAIKADLTAESKLEAEYTELLASASLEFRGETYNFPSFRKFFQDADRDTRHEASRVHWQWYTENGEQLDRIYDDLVGLRTKMARQLGYDDFVALGYKRMSRIDYDQADVERFRASVRDHVVPLAHELRRRQAADLGLDHLMAWDEPVQDVLGNPEPKGDHDWMLERAQEMFDSMGSGLDGFFRLMNEGGFLDLKSRKGKAGGGFCTAFPVFGMPYVFANFNGTQDDIQVFTHEIGHAFQCYESRGQKPMDYLWPTLESCEIHSMSLEFLSYPHMEKFFGEDADRFRKNHLTDALYFLPYGTLVDHFQHEVYGKPDMTPAERKACWRELEQAYLPWRDWGDLEYPEQGGFWQRQPHIYASPFYYIDYVLAQTCALQFWVRAEKDRDEAMKAYVALCRRGGEAPFQELARSAGVDQPVRRRVSGRGRGHGAVDTRGVARYARDTAGRGVAA